MRQNAFDRISVVPITFTYYFYNWLSISKNVYLYFTLVFFYVFKSFYYVALEMGMQYFLLHNIYLRALVDP